MSEQSVNHLITRIEDVIDYARKEDELSYAELLGCLAFVRVEVERELMDEQRAMEEDDAR